MVKSNAERQREYRARRNAAARGDSLGQMAQDAIDAALADVWAIINRPARDGRMWFDAEGFANIDAYRQHCAAEGAPHLLIVLEEYLEEATPDELLRLKRAADVVRAALLKHVAMPEKRKPRGRG